MKGERIKLVKPKEIRSRLRHEKDDGIRLKLIFLNAVANFSMDLESACSMCGIAVSTGYLWIRNWNEEGYDGMKDKPNSGGRPPKLDEEDLEELRAELKQKDYWTTQEVKGKILDKFGVDLSEDQIRRILRNKLNMLFSKPFPMDYRRPIDAELILENQIDLTFSLLEERGISLREVAIGFVDETRPQNTANTVRVWSFEKVRAIKNTTKFGANTIGFYAINGKSVKEFLQDSKATSIAQFLESIKSANQEYKSVIIVIDNFASHRSKLVRDKAKELGIFLVYLPPYSPDLNPIEFIWKSIKRILSVSSVGDECDMRRIISDSWDRFSNSLSYAEAWIRKFMPNGNYNRFCGRL
jgi:transposase